MSLESQTQSGLAVLMFTDIIGSVELQAQLGTAAYTELVGWHDEIFRQCLDSVPGFEILNETGDGFLVRFRTPSDAVITALRIQYRLAREAHSGQSVRVRIGIHLGVVTEMVEKLRGERRVVGMPINVAGRVMGMAGGGQILMTGPIYDDARHHVREHPASSGEVEGKAPPALRWLSHGPYHFKGGQDAIEIFEVGAEGVAPLRAPEASDKSWPAGSEGPGVPATPPPPTQEIDKSDIYLSYAPIDDCSVHAGHQGWISQFHRNLEVRMKQLTGDDVSIYRDPATEDSVPSEKVVHTLPEMKALVSIISPPFAKSERCQKEIEAFLAEAGSAGARPGRLESLARVNRLVSAIKSPVLPSHLPPFLNDLLSQRTPHEFFERDMVTGRAREFDDTLGETERRRYQERIYDLAYELRDVLRDKPIDVGAGSPEGVPEKGRHVYLAQATSDLQEEYSGIRRELLEQGFVVLPDKPLPTEAASFDEAVRGYLAKCGFAIHLVGRNYGLIPENERTSMAEMQNALAAKRAKEGGLVRFVWLPRPLKIEDDRQKDFVRRLNEDEDAQEGAEVIQATLSSFKELLQARLCPRETVKTEEAPSAAAKPKDASRVIYLVCDRADETAVEALEDYLFERGLHVVLPDFQSDQEEMGRLHRASLNDCDAVLIYYGQAHKAWVDIQLRDALKAPGYGRSQPIHLQAVYVAPPADRRKDRFRCHGAAIVKQEGDAFTPTPELEQFVNSILE